MPGLTASFTSRLSLFSPKLRGGSQFEVPNFLFGGLVGLAVKLVYALASGGWFPTSMKRPLPTYLSFWEGTPIS